MQSGLSAYQARYYKEESTVVTKVDLQLVRVSSLLIFVVASAMTTACDRLPPAMTGASPGSAVGVVGSYPSTEKILPPYRAVLERTGWLNYVNANIDVIRFYNFPAFQSDQGPALGIAHYENGRRIADIAINGRSDVEVAATLVHEAAHLAGIGEFGTYLDQDVAVATEARFRADVQPAFANRTHATGGSR
jgi:hypothetical protein